MSKITNDKILWCAYRNTFEFQISTTHPKTFINKMIEFKKEQKQNSDILSFVCLARPNVATNYTFTFLVQWLSIMEDKNRNHFLPKKDIYTLLHRNVASFQRLIQHISKMIHLILYNPLIDNLISCIIYVKLSLNRITNLFVKSRYSHKYVILYPLMIAFYLQLTSEKCI